MSSVQPCVESLEYRRLLSASLSDAGLLRVAGSDGVNDNLVVRLSSNRQNIEVLINGSMVRSYDEDDVDRIQMKGKNGNDTLRIDHSRGDVNAPVKMIGGSGNDRLLAG